MEFICTDSSNVYIIDVGYRYNTYRYNIYKNSL